MMTRSREGSVSHDNPQQTLVEALEKGSAGHDDLQQTLAGTLH